MFARSRTLRYALTIAACCMAASTALAAENLLVEGTLSGLFMTPEGDLVGRHIPLTDSGDGGDREPLHPLWGRRYLRVGIVAQKPIERITLTSADGETVWREELEEPARRYSVPCDGETPLRDVVIAPEHGLPFVLALDHADGSSSRTPLKLHGTRLLPRPEPKIDWVALEHIGAAREFLRERGNEVLPGFQADEVPFAVNGEEHMLLIDHPSPPMDFRPYDGPSPIDAVLHFGPADPDIPALAWATMIGDAPTAILHRPMTVLDADELEPPYEPEPAWLHALVHEACHCMWPRLPMYANSRRGLPTEALAPAPVRTCVLQALQRDALQEAVLGPPEETAARATEYLALREECLRSDPRAEQVAGALEELRTTEGFAQIATVTICPPIQGNIFVDRPQPEPTLFERLVQEVDSDSARVTDTALDFRIAGAFRHPRPHLMGLAQAAALMRIREDAVRTAWAEDRLLVDQLSREVGWDELSDDERAAMRQTALDRWEYEERLAATRSEMRDARAALLGRLRAARRGEEQALELRIILPSTPEMADVQWDDPRFFASFHWYEGDNVVQMRQPCMVRSWMDGETLVREVRTAFDGDMMPFATKRRGNEVLLGVGGSAMKLVEPVIAADGTLVTVSSGLPRSPSDGLALKPLIDCGERYVVPVACDTGGPMAARDIPVVSLEMSMEGIFRDHDSLAWRSLGLAGIEEMKHLNLLQGEIYRCEMQMRDAVGQSLGSLKLVAEGRTVPGEVSAGGRLATAIAEFAALRDIDIPSPSGSIDCDAGGRWDWTWDVIREDVRIHVFQEDYGAERAGTRQMPLPGATVRVWPPGHEKLARSAVTDEEGDAGLEGIPSSVVIVEVTHPEACGVRIERPTGGNVRVYRHHGFRGAVSWKGPDAPKGPPTVEIEAPDGSAIPVTVEEKTQEARRVFAYTTDAVRAGKYRITAEWGGHEMTDVATVRDACTLALSYAGNTPVEGTAGQHSPVQVPIFGFPPNKQPQ
jgi:hypothetical protein